MLSGVFEDVQTSRKLPESGIHISEAWDCDDQHDEDIKEGEDLEK